MVTPARRGGRTRKLAVQLLVVARREPAKTFAVFGPETYRSKIMRVVSALCPNVRLMRRDT